MKTSHVPHGRISEHFQGLGAVSSDTVVARAREIALTNGRPPNHFTETDFLQAKRELLGADGDGEIDDPAASLIGWDEAPDSAGHSVDKIEAPDEQMVAAELIEEGVAEAEHDQMVAGARNHHA